MSNAELQMMIPKVLDQYSSLVSSNTYEDNLKTLGAGDKNTPTQILIYAKDFDSKQKITDLIEEYNKTHSEAQKIEYTDYIGMLLTGVSKIVNIVSYVLIAFVAISLVVSSIMIGVITYISVLERTKEIGILRALGASKRNISQVFNAETFIIGLCAGVMGIIFSEILIVPINSVIRRVAGGVDVTARLPLHYSAVLIAISMAMTVIGGFIPAKRAAKKDPVIALRTE